MLFAELEKDLPPVAAMRDMPNEAGEEVAIDPWHAVRPQSHVFEPENPTPGTVRPEWRQLI